MRGLLAALVLVAVATGTACRREPQVARPPSIVAAVPAPRPNVDRASGCERQAARFAAWREQSRGGGAVSWVAHYSTRDDLCYALLALAAPVGRERQPAIVTELWDVFGPTLFAESTADPRPEARRTFCRIDLSEDPFASCEVTEFFVREHMAH
jgi:hypothetical protein